VEVVVDIGDDVEDVPEPEKLCLFRVVQEALTNCSRHSGASSIQITLRRAAEGTLLQVKDNGKGFETPRNGIGGIGLIGIEERVRELNGSVRIRSKQGTGTTLSVQIPAPANGGVHVHN